MSTTGSRLRRRLWMAGSGLVLVVLGLASVLAVPLLGLMAVAWTHPGHDVTYMSNTPHRLWVCDAKGRLVTELAPFETSTGGEYEHLWTGRRVAKTQDGRVVFTVDLTWDEPKAQDYRIVIEEQGVPPPTATP